VKSRSKGEDMDDEIKEYGTVCEVCDTEVELSVFGFSDLPCFCPMCGFGTEWDELESEDYN